MAAIDDRSSLGFQNVIGSAEELNALYGSPSDSVVSKVIDRIDQHCRDFIARSPFVLVATTDAEGRCDASPKGGDPGFVAVVDEHRIAIPDAPGNKLVYSLQNIEATGRAGLIFLIPGMEETLRVNGRACLTRDHELLDSLGHDGKVPGVAIGIEVEEAFLHCAKAFKRSKLWQPDGWPSRDGLARPAQIWKDHMALQESADEVERWVDEDYRTRMY